VLTTVSKSGSPDTGGVLALDAGTTSVRAVAFNAAGERLAWAQHPVTQYYPQSGWVEHDADEILAVAARVIRDVSQNPRSGKLTALGLTNQRETVVVWERGSGRPIHRAIVWQDRRTESVCAELRAAGVEDAISACTGLRCDPYFSATKIAWILDHVAGARERADRGELLAGTIDTWLIWQLTGGRVHATDPTNASRTLLYDLRQGAWDESLCAQFRVPRSLLAEIRPTVGDFGHLDPYLTGSDLPIRAAIGDQQAAAVGQGCVQPGSAKATFGTGAFVLLHTGGTALRSQQRLLSTVALDAQQRSAFALEGSIFNAGTVVQWLRDDLGVIADAPSTSALAATVPDTGGVVIVPAFTGLGAPWWDADARGLICGLTRATTAAHLARAALEAVAYQTEDLLVAMAGDGQVCAVLRVDGGMAANDWFCQFLADQLGIVVERPIDIETTVRGAAILALSALSATGVAGLTATQAAAWWQLERQFQPDPTVPRAARRLAWLAAVARARS